jgi:DNA-binding GntR family transcriptional regulator
MDSSWRGQRPSVSRDSAAAEVRLSNANENIYAELRRRIMAGGYEPGVQLKEEVLAAELAVSRTPVRTALRRLVNEGLLEAKANRGAFVAQWTNRDIDEVIDLRCMLESHAALLAATRATKEQITQLAALNRRMAELSRGATAEQIAELQALNNSFHQLILTAACSPRLSAATRVLIDWPLIVGIFYVFSEADIVRSVQYHDDLLLAIDAGDAQMARRVMDAHLRSSHFAYRSRRTRPPSSVIAKTKE